MSKKISKKFDFWMLFLWNMIAFPLALKVSTNYLVTALFFFVLPSIYLFFRKPSITKKTALASLIFTIPFTIIFAYLGYKDGSWINFSLTGIKILDVYPAEDFIWGFMYIFYIIQFYEYFFDKDTVKTIIPKKLYIFNIAAAIIAIIFISLITLAKNVLIIPYFYAFFVIIFMILFPALIISTNKKILNGIVSTGFFFFFLSLLYEYVATATHQWAFPGSHFIGYVSLFNVTFPFEELMWLIFCVPAIVAYYELFADDLK